MQNMKKSKPKIPTSTMLRKKILPLPYIQLTATTWAKDSHGLYDYEAPDNKQEKQIFNIAKSAKIYRNMTQFTTYIVDDEDMRPMPAHNIYIASVILDRNTNTFEVQSGDVSGVVQSESLIKEYPEIYQNSYLVVKDYEKDGIQGYELGPGCVIKFGRVEYMVLEIRNDQGTSTFKQTSHLDSTGINYTVETPLVGCCKISLSQESTEQDPLISPCLCKGSCQFVHVSCLKNWINSKIKKEFSDIVLSINFSKFECEICKAPFPKTVTLTNGQVIDMISLEKPEKPYIILESVNSKQDKKQTNLHMIFAHEGLALKIGRGHQCQLRINDISVSRSHAEVFYKNGKFYLKDLKSKFGTLVKFKEKMTVKEGSRLQYGRVCFDFNLKYEQPKLSVQDDTSQEDPTFKI